LSRGTPGAAFDNAGEGRCGAGSCAKTFLKLSKKFPNRLFRFLDLVRLSEIICLKLKQNHRNGALARFLRKYDRFSQDCPRPGGDHGTGAPLAARPGIEAAVSTSETRSAEFGRQKGSPGQSSLFPA
jgi:hypothetical protein